MTRAQLIQKLADLEWEDFEVKEAKGTVPKSAWETVSAFSNTSGGWLVFGIKQSGKSFDWMGVENPEQIEQDFLNTLRSGQKFNTLINPKCVRHTVEGRTVLLFYICPSAKKPVYFNSQSNTYIRKGSSDQQATKEEIDTMFRDQTFGTKTAELISGSSVKLLKEKSLKEYRDYMSRFNPDASYNKLELADALEKLRVVDAESGSCTFGGLLFFGKRTSIEQYFPDFRIDLLEIPGTTYAEASSRYTFRLAEDDYENLWEAYFECFKRLRKEVDVDFKLSAEGFGSELSQGLLALREALVNLLMHADYFAPGCPRIRVFSDQIEFYNPGGLPKPLDEIRKNDLSIPRNPILAKLFRMVKLSENAGFGFDKIEDNWKEYSGIKPVVSANFDSTLVQLNKTVEKVVVKDNPTLAALKSQLTTSLADNQKLLDEYYELFLNHLENELLASEELRKNFARTSEELRKNFVRTSQESPDNFVENSQTLRSDFGDASEIFRRHFGDTSETFRRNFGDKPALLFFIIAIDNRITAKEAQQYLEVSSRSVQMYFSHLNALGLISREGSTKRGYWQIKFFEPDEDFTTEALED